jgi:hypothetical protein
MSKSPTADETEACRIRTRHHIIHCDGGTCRHEIVIPAYAVEGLYGLGGIDQNTSTTL